VRTLLVSAPVMDSSVLKVRCVGRLGDTLSTSLRCDRAATSRALICTVSARIDGCTACTAPPICLT
jgi:hypothetical protein